MWIFWQLVALPGCTWGRLLRMVQLPCGHQNGNHTWGKTRNRTEKVELLVDNGHVREVDVCFWFFFSNKTREKKQWKVFWSKMWGYVLQVHCASGSWRRQPCRYGCIHTEHLSQKLKQCLFTHRGKCHSGCSQSLRTQVKWIRISLELKADTNTIFF